MKKKAFNTVASPVQPRVGLVSVDAATPWKKKRKNTSPRVMGCSFVVRQPFRK